MKVSLLQENLAKGVSMVGRMITGKTQLPVLDNILLETEKGQLKLSATNLETGMNVRLGGRVENEGKVTVPARIFSELMSSLPKETVFLDTEADKLKVVCGRFRTIINGISAEEFPAVPSLYGEKIKGEGALRLKKEELEASVEQVALAAGTDEARPVFTGVKLEIGGGKIRMAATDGYRLSVKTIKVMSGAKKKKQMVVPARALMELNKTLRQGGDEVVIKATEEEKQLIMATKEVEIVTRLLEGDFPDFEKIIPTSFSTKIEVETEELLKAVKVAAIFAKDSANIVKFRVEKKGLVISANAPQVGENVAVVEGTKTGEDGEIAFNSRYLIEMLSVIKEETIQLSLSGPLNPGVFKVLQDKDFLHIIMPVRVQD